VLPHLEQRLAACKLDAKVWAEEECIYVDYATQAQRYGYVAARVKIEFGGRSTGEPAEKQEIRCDAADFVPTIVFPTATPRVMRVERTAWEKMTAISIFCRQKNIKDRLARHWYDIAKLDAAGHIDYATSINGGLTLVPTGETLEALHTDYEKMIEDGLFLGNPEPFEWVIDRCRDVERRANAVAARGS
jgi:hypothetical protein